MKNSRISRRQFFKASAFGAGSLTSPGIVLALVAAAVVLITACGAWPPAPPMRSAAATPVTPADIAQRVDVGGRSLYLECRGEGSPTVLLEAGLRNRADVWSVQASPTSTETMVFPGVAAFTRVWAYDRPGTASGPDAWSRCRHRRIHSAVGWARHCDGCHVPVTFG